MTGLVGMFIPFSSTMDLVMAIGGTLLFSGYIVYDTYIINSKLSPDEYIMGAISLYLEYVTSYFLLFTYDYNISIHTASSTSVSYFDLLRPLALY